MEIITTHTNADFDSLAGMTAAQKLYPDARIVFSGSQERPLRDFFLRSSAARAVSSARLKDIDFSAVTRLVLVDTKSRNRIGRFADLLSRPDLSIHIYDHHPFLDDDIRGDVERVEPVGATATLMAEILAEKGIGLTPYEATILMLGIYEETGSLTFASTTPRDLESAARLLRQGADLNVVSDFIIHELDAEQVDLLNDFLHSARTIAVGGVPILVATAERAHYVGDMALVVHKLRDTVGAGVVIAIAQMEDRVHVVIRSRLSEIDAGTLAAVVGGGGHSTAASATVRDAALSGVEARLLDRLRATARPLILAHQIMTAPVKTIEAHRTLAEANDLMTRYGVNVFPVVEPAGNGGRLIGLISRETVQKSIFHALGNEPVETFMRTDFRTASPDTPLSEIEESMIEHNQRFMPVLGNGQVIGAITRTDLLRAMHDFFLRATTPEGLPMEEGFPSRAIRRNVASLMAERLPGPLFLFLRSIAALADRMETRVYLVGGIVRDLFLGIENLDADLVVEGDGIAFAEAIVREVPGRVRPHKPFGTAVVVLDSGLKIDVASARTEVYETLAALPTVELSSIKKDLYRRDFTINTLAIRLSEGEFGQLLDFFGGRRDLKERTIRVLHDLSFVEDPTRVFRAIRFEQRFDFKISRHTKRLVETAVAMDMFHRLSGPRLYGELWLIFEEADPAKTVQRLKDLDLLRFIHPRLDVSGEKIPHLARVKEALAWYALLFQEPPVRAPMVYMTALLDHLEEADVLEVAARLSISPTDAGILLLPRRTAPSVLRTLSRRPPPAPSVVYEALSPVPIEGLLYLLASARPKSAQKTISEFITHGRFVRPPISGDDLTAMGLAPGPIYRQIMAELRAATIDGKLKGREEAIAWVKEKYGESGNR